MAGDTPQARILRQAEIDVGGRARLARALVVTEAQLAGWLDDKEDVPAHVFFKALDIVARRFPLPFGLAG